MTAAAHVLEFDPPEPTEPVLDPPEPHACESGEASKPENLPVLSTVLVGEVVAEPTMLIPTASILQRMEGITASDRVQAALLGQQALAITAIRNDDDEVIVGEMIDRLTTHQEHIERKVNPFAEIAFRLHRAEIIVSVPPSIRPTRSNRAASALPLLENSCV